MAELFGRRTPRRGFLKRLMSSHNLIEVEMNKNNTYRGFVWRGGEGPIDYRLTESSEF